MKYSIKQRLKSGIFSVHSFIWLYYFHLIFNESLGTAEPIKTNTLLTALMQFTGALYKVVSCGVLRFKPQREFSHIPLCLDESVLALESAAIYPTMNLIFSAVFPVEFATRTISL